MQLLSLGSALKDFYWTLPKRVEGGEISRVHEFEAGKHVGPRVQTQVHPTLQVCFLHGVRFLRSNEKVSIWCIRFSEKKV